MAKEVPTPCSHCQELQARLDQLQTRLTEVEQQLAQARKDSSPSSKPPSSDLVKPAKAPPANGRSKRQRGGQPGHPRQQRLRRSKPMPDAAPVTSATLLSKCSFMRARPNRKARIGRSRKASLELALEAGAI